MVARLATALLEYTYPLVTGVSDPRQAIPLALSGEYALLLTDVEMPHYRGPDLAAHIGSLGVKLTVLYMTGLDEAEYPRELDDLGRESVLRKPWTNAALVLAVGQRMAPLTDARPRAIRAPRR